MVLGLGGHRISVPEQLRRKLPDAGQPDALTHPNALGTSSNAVEPASDAQADP